MNLLAFGRFVLDLLFQTSQGNSPCTNLASKDKADRSHQVLKMFFKFRPAHSDPSFYLVGSKYHLRKYSRQHNMFLIQYCTCSILQLQLFRMNRVYKTFPVVQYQKTESVSVYGLADYPESMARNHLSVLLTLGDMLFQICHLKNIFHRDQKWLRRCPEILTFVNFIKRIRPINKEN